MPRIRIHLLPMTDWCWGARSPASLHKVGQLRCKWNTRVPCTMMLNLDVYSFIFVLNFPSLNKQNLGKMSRESMMPSNHLIFCRRLFLLISVFPSIRVFSNESALRIRWPKYWSYSFNISPSNEHTGLISFRMDWLDHCAFQGALKSLLQHHSSKASFLQHSTS